jgi:hypothetical protein
VVGQAAERSGSLDVIWNRRHHLGADITGFGPSKRDAWTVEEPRSRPSRNERFGALDTAEFDARRAADGVAALLRLRKGERESVNSVGGTQENRSEDG